MPRHNRSIEGGKIRKRGCSSSSSSSSVLQNYRFKRALLVARRGGSSTPVPTWKMSSRSPTCSSVGGGIPQSPKYPPSQRGGGGGGGGGCSKTKQAPPVSARKLAATLWEMNEVPSPSPRMGRKEDYLEEEEEEEEVVEQKRISNKRELMRVRGGKDRINATTTSSVHSASLPPHLSDPSHSPVSERLDRSGIGSHRRRTSTMSQRFRLTDHNNGGFDSGSNANLMEIDVRSRGLTPTGSVGGVKNLLKDLSNGLTTSKELLKILGRIWGLEEHHSSSMSLVSALRGEIERAHGQVNQLIREHRADRNEINYLMKYFAEEKAAWKRKEQERIQAAMNSVAGDLEAERKLRRRTESLNKTLGRELADTKAALAKAVKELDGEKRAREIMEQICDELARGIGEDKAEVEELKRESAIVREEVEKEREMLQLADVLREERVQMKLSEAKYQFEEKNAAVDKLRNELEVYLKTKKAKENNKSRSQNCEINEDIEIHLSKAKIFNLNEGGEDDDGEVDHGDIDTEEEQDESAESDLHSIELNMDNAKSYRWNYANGAAQEDPRRASVEEEIKGRKSTSEKMTRGNIISLERQMSGGTDQWDFSTENLPSWEGGYNRGGFSELLDKQQQLPNGCSDFELENQRYKSMKGLRDDILSRAKIALAQGSSSPTRQWGGQPRSSRDPGSASSGRPSIVRERSFKGRLVEARGGEIRIQDGKKIKSSFS